METNFVEKYLQQFEQELFLRNYSKRTIEIYTNALKGFLQYSQKHPITPQLRIRDFLFQFKNHPEALRLKYNAIQTFYKFVLQKNCPYKLERVRKKKRMPKVFTKEEIQLILSKISNQKHRVMIAMLYGSGLRLSELIHLKVKDLDLQSLVLTVRQGKGKKDRYTTISQKVKPFLQELIKEKKMNEYLFSSMQAEKYSSRTVQVIFNRAAKAANLESKGTCHTLRHSFASHLLEDGVNIKIIQDMLGHNSIKTTMIYLHTLELKKNNIVSPL